MSVREVQGRRPHLLGRHVAGGAQDQRRVRLLDAGELGQPEVGHPGVALLGDHDVGALHVAVDDPLGVGGVETLGHLERDVRGLAVGEGAAGQPALQVEPFGQGHGDEDLLVELLDGVDGADVGVIEGGRGLGLAEEAAALVVAAQRVSGQELEGHLPAQGEVLGPVHDAHASLAELLEDAVVGHRGADHVGVSLRAFPRAFRSPGPAAPAASRPGRRARSSASCS